MEFCRRSVVGTNCFWSKRGVFFLTWLLNGTNRGMSSLSVYSLGLSKKKKKMWPSSLFAASILNIIISTHSLYEKGGVSFFKF